MRLIYKLYFGHVFYICSLTLLLPKDKESYIEKSSHLEKRSEKKEKHNQRNCKLKVIFSTNLQRNVSKHHHGTQHWTSSEGKIDSFRLASLNSIKRAFRLSKRRLKGETPQNKQQLLQ